LFAIAALGHTRNRALADESDRRGALGVRSSLAKNLGGEHDAGLVGGCGRSRNGRAAISAVVQWLGRDVFLLATIAVLDVVLRRGEQG
jgi:hypothetical protein